MYIETADFSVTNTFKSNETLVPIYSIGSYAKRMHKLTYTRIRFPYIFTKITFWSIFTFKGIKYNDKILKKSNAATAYNTNKHFELIEAHTIQYTVTVYIQNQILY